MPPPSGELRTEHTTAARGDDGDATDTACAGQDGLVAIARGPIAARWDHHLSYAGEGTIDVHWCGEDTVYVSQVAIREGRARWTIDYAERTRPARRGAPIALAVRGQPHVGALPAIVVAVDESGVEHRATVILESIDDPDRSAAIAACNACGGDWGPIGMAGTETCDCPTHDAGTRCTSDDDCEGACIATGWEPLSADEVGALTTESAGAATCPRGHRLERQVGRCHGRQHAFGCRPRIDDPAPRCQPIGFARRLDTICTD